MKKKLLVLAWPVGFILFLIYVVTNRYLIPFPEMVAYPWMITSVLCMLVGCFYNGYCKSIGKDPYTFKD